jgi:hypothetical protein
MCSNTLIVQFVLFDTVLFSGKLIPAEVTVLPKMRHVIATVISVTDVDLRDDDGFLYGVRGTVRL